MRTHLTTQEIDQLTAIVGEAMVLGGITLMKKVNNPRNHGKIPELVMAEALVTAYQMFVTVNGGVDGE